jgi:death-on-curing protein
LEQEPFFLSRDQIDTIHHDQIEAFGGIHGIRSEDALESAIAQPMNVWYYSNGDLYAPPTRIISHSRKPSLF